MSYIVPIVLLVALVFLTFGRTLSSYFLADDFDEIAYVSRIFNGEPGLFFSNFTGNFMQVPGMSVYRPWLLCSLVIDWLIFHVQAWGYYLTNVLHFAFVAVLLYLSVRLLTKRWGTGRSALTAFFAGALFAVSPLHCESVSWVVGRVDILAAFFYLAGFCCFVANFSKRSRLRTICGIVAFVLALTSKEMAVGLPPLVATAAFLWADEQANTESSDHPAIGFKSRLRSAFIFSMPLFLTLAIYFIVRWLCLKTLVGGYVGGIGASQLAGVVQRWLDVDTLGRLFIPLNQHLFGSNPSYGTVYGTKILIVYVVLAALAIVRVCSKKISWQWFIFLAVWCATAAAPIFQLWGLGYDLQGARFYFFLTMPLSVLIPVLIFHPGSASAEEQTDKIVSAVGALAMLFLLLLFQKATVQTNRLWVRAGYEVRKLSQTCQAPLSITSGW